MLTNAQQSYNSKNTSEKEESNYQKIFGSQWKNFKSLTIPAARIVINKYELKILSVSKNFTYFLKTRFVKIKQ